MEKIIETNHLTKNFGKFTAVDDINLCVRKGEIYGFLGLNGAGKTTTIRMLTGMIRPTAGTAYLNGQKVTAGNSHQWEKVGYLVEVPYSYPDLTVRENLEIIRRLRLIPDAKTVDSIIEKLQLGQYVDRLEKNLSRGNAQRLGLAKALIHNPDILILDEPANGLDPAGIVEIRELLRDLALNRGVTVFISSHILGEISRFATRIGIIHEGRLLRESDSEELERLRRRSLHLNMADKDGAQSFLVKKGFSISGIKEGFLEIIDQNAIDDPGMVNTMLVQAGFPPTMLKIEEEDLESYFFRVIGRNGGVQ